MSNWHLLLERLLAEDIEFFVSEVRDLPPDPRVDVRSLGRQPGRFHVRAGHPLAGAPCTLAEAWRHGVAATRLPSAVKAVVARLLGLPAGETPVLALECDDVSLLREVALATDTVVGLTDVSVRDAVASGALVPLEVEGVPALYSEMGLVTLARRTPSPMAQRAMERLRIAAARLNEGYRRLPV